MLERFTGGRPKPPGKLGKAWSISIICLAPVFVYYVFTAHEPVPWNIRIPSVCFVLGGVAGALSRLWHRRRRLAYGLHATGALTFQAGMIAFIAGFGIRGEWGWFWYGLFVYGVIALLAASGVFYPDSSTRDAQREERS